MEDMGLNDTEKLAGMALQPRIHFYSYDGADEIMNKFANTQLEEKSSIPTEPSSSTTRLPLDDPNTYFYAPYLPEEEEEKYDLAMKKLANHALDLYCEKQGIELDLIEVLSSGEIYEPDIYAYHITCLVIPKHDSSGSRKRFFAEVCQSKMGEIKVTFCDFIDQNNRERVGKMIDGRSSALKRWNKCKDFVKV